MICDLLNMGLSMFGIPRVRALAKTHLCGWMSVPITDVRTLDTSTSYGCRMEVLCLDVQRDFCRALEKLEGKHARFRVDRVVKDKGHGGSIVCVLQDGAVFEKAGISVTVSKGGSLSPAAVMDMKSKLKQLAAATAVPFAAVSVSCIVHPRSPHVPALHFNYRYFEAWAATGQEGLKEEGEREEEKGRNDVTAEPQKVWWYGGGTDLTPCFLEEEDVRHFHGVLQRACDKHDSTYYAKFKAICDRYFFLKHRGECRGVGGIFFDSLNTPDQESVFGFVQSCARSVCDAYVPIVERRQAAAYTLADREWQLIRRGRYAEFNLLYDRGTRFGLETSQARVESVLMSMPPLTRWEYCHDYYSDARKAALMDVLKNPRDWV